ncbi:hypothetical protein [Pseudomonas shirazensis]|uniref:hypothetical protein n=1 Tax=Pseudomonas shirazensis TaxID=2745494 RepID=UPI003D282E53
MLANVTKSIVCCGVLTFMISGCESTSAVTTMFAFSDTPLAQATVEAGATREDILKVEQPENSTRLASGGLCFDYAMRGKGRVSPYYVAFTTNGHVMNYGWTTCAAAAARGNLSSNEALKQRF